MTVSWTPDDVARLREMAAQGKWASEIAQALGKSRRAVIAASHRYGARLLRTQKEHAALSRKPVRPRRKRHAPRKRRKNPNRQAPQCEWIDIPEDIPVEQRKTLIELGTAGLDGLCHWPCGDPQHPDFFFCGGPAEIGSPYCAHHRARAKGKPEDLQW